MIIERPTGKIEVFDNGIIHNQYNSGITILGSHATEEMSIFEGISQRFGGRMLLLNDLRGRISTDREARTIYGEYTNPDAYVAFVFDSKIVEIGFNFIQRLYPMNVTKKAFQELEPAIAWLEGFVLPEHEPTPR